MNTHCSHCRFELLVRAWRPGWWFGHLMTCVRLGEEPDRSTTELMSK